MLTDIAGRRSASEIESSELRPGQTLPGVVRFSGAENASRLSEPGSWSIAQSMSSIDTRAIIEEVVSKLPDLLRADLASRDPAIRQSAEEVVAAKIALALEELRAA